MQMVYMFDNLAHTHAQEWQNKDKIFIEMEKIRKNLVDERQNNRKLRKYARVQLAARKKIGQKRSK